MNTHSDKTTDDKSQSAAHELARKEKQGKSGVQFVDNRLEAVAQRKLKAMAHNFPTQFSADLDSAGPVSDVIQGDDLQGLPNFRADCFVNAVLQVMAGSYKELFDPNRNPLSSEPKTQIQTAVFALLNKVNDANQGAVDPPAGQNRGAVQALRQQLLGSGLVRGLEGHEDAQELMIRLLDIVTDPAGRRLIVPDAGPQLVQQDDTLATFAFGFNKSVQQILEANNNMVNIDSYRVKISGERRIEESEGRDRVEADDTQDQAAKTPEYTNNRRQLGDEMTTMIPVDISAFPSFHHFLNQKFSQGASMNLSLNNHPRALNDDQAVTVKKAKEVFTFKKLPVVLTFYLKRFTGFLTKDDQDFPMPSELFLKEQTEQDPTTFKEYKLESYIIHTGGVGGGHYRAHRKHEDLWYEMNDSMVTPRGGNPVMEISSSYIYTYKLINTHNALPQGATSMQEEAPVQAPVEQAEVQQGRNSGKEAPQASHFPIKPPSRKPETPQQEADALTLTVEKIIRQAADETRKYYDHWCERMRNAGAYDMYAILAEERIEILAKLNGLYRRARLTNAGTSRPSRRISTLENIYAQVQKERAKLIMMPKKIIAEGVGSKEAEESAGKVVSGDIDYRVIRLMALLDKGKKSKSQDRFTAVMKWVAGGEGAELEKKYNLSVGPKRNLKKDLATVFESESLFYQYLLLHLEGGGPTPAAQLAIKLGLLYRGHTPFDIVDKERVEGLIRANPTGFKNLVTGKGDPFSEAAFAYLKKKKPKFLEELVNLVRLAETSSEKEESQGKGKETTTNRHAAYLYSIIYSEDRREFRNTDFWSGKVKDLVPKVLTWASDLATPEARKAFVFAGRHYASDEAWFAYMRGNELKEPENKLPGYDAYKGFWTNITVFELASSSEIEYMIKMVSRLDQPAKTGGQDVSKIIEVEALLEKQAKRWAGGKRKERTGIKHQVLAMLSATSDWDPQLAMIQRYDEEAYDQYLEQSREGPQPGLRNTAFRKVFQRNFAPKMTAAGMSSRQIEQVGRQLKYQGSYGDDADEFRKIDVYQKLKRLVAKTGDISGSDVLKIVSALQTGSLDMHLLQNDSTLLGALQFFVRDNGSVFSYRSRQQNWKTFMAIVGLEPGKWNKGPIPVGYETHLPDMTGLGPVGSQESYRFERPARPRKKEPDILTGEGVGALERESERIKSATDQSQKGGLAKYWAGRISAEYQKGITGRDGNRMLEIVFSAQGSGLNGHDLAAALGTIDTSALEWVSHKGKSTGHDRKARGHLKRFFGNKKEKLSVEDLLDASKWKTKHGADKDAIDFTITSLSPEEALAQWVDQEDLDSLKELADQRFEKRLSLMKARIEGTQDTVQLEGELDLLSQRINHFHLKISQALDDKLESVTKRGKRHEIKRKVLAKLNEAMQRGESAQIQQIKITPEERESIGIQTQGVADVTEQSYLESGVAWHHRSTAATEASEGMGKFLGKMWDTQKELAEMSSDPESDPQKLSGYAERRKQMIAELRESETELRKAQDVWKKTQDRLNAQTKAIISIIVGLIITAAGLITGIGAAPGLIQVIWTISTILLQEAIKYAIDAGLKREGDVEGAQALQDTVVAVFSGVAGHLIGAELALAVDLAGMGWHTGNEAQQIFGKPLLAIAKQQVTGLVGDATEGTVNRFFAKHPISRMLPDIMGSLKQRLISLPKDAFVTFIKGVASEGLRIGNNKMLVAILKEKGVLDEDGKVIPGNEDVAAFFKYQPTGSFAANFTEGDDFSKAETAKQSLFDFGRTDDPWAINLGVYAGGPTASMGSSAWAGDKENYELSGWNFANAAKTILYEEYLFKKAGGAVGNWAGGIFDTVTGKQDQTAVEERFGKAKPQESPSPIGASYEAWGKVFEESIVEEVAAKSMRIVLASMGMEVDEGLNTTKAVIQAVLKDMPNKKEAEEERRINVQAALETMQQQARLEAARAIVAPLGFKAREIVEVQMQIYNQASDDLATLLATQGQIDAMSKAASKIRGGLPGGIPGPITQAIVPLKKTIELVAEHQDLAIKGVGDTKLVIALAEGLKEPEDIPNVAKAFSQAKASQEKIEESKIKVAVALQEVAKAKKLAEDAFFDLGRTEESETVEAPKTSQDDSALNIDTPSRKDKFKKKNRTVEALLLKRKNKY